MAEGWTRRALLAAGAGAFAAPLVAQTAPARRSRIVLLGTKGGPTPSRFRATASNLLLVDGAPFVIDCPDGVAERRLPCRRRVTIGELLQEWVFHDRNHLRQVLLSAQARVWPAMGNTRRFTRSDG